MKKEKELVSIYNANGWTVCRIFDKQRCCFYSERFLWYPKVEIIRKLRCDGVVVSKRFA